MTLTHRQAVWLMVANTLMWSIAGVVTRQLTDARSFEVTFWRSFFTAVSLLVILPLWQGKGALARVAWGSRALWLSGLCWSVMFTAFMLALTLTTVANVLLTLAAGPLLTALVSRVVTGHKLPLRTWVAIGVAGVGIVWMFGSQLGLGVPSGASGARSPVLGMLVALCVPVAASVQWTLTQRLQQRAGNAQQVDLVPAVLIGAVLSSVATLPLALPFSASGGDVAWLALLGLVQLAIPCALCVVCARALAGPEVSLLALLEVVFGIALAWLGAGEQPSGAVLSGGLLVVGALVCNEWLGWKQKQ